MQTENVSRKEARKQYYLKNRERIREKAKRDYVANRDVRRKAARERYQSNREQEYARGKAWRENNPIIYKASLRASQLRRKYGLSLEDFDNLLARQNNSCAICSSKEATWCVDHCHTTGEVRGILCSSCNKGLGMFKDDQTNLENAINYLNRVRQPKRS